MRIGELSFVEHPTNPGRPLEDRPHNVERRRYKVLQPLRILRSDNCVSEQDCSSMPQIATSVSEFPHRLTKTTSVATL